LRRHEFVIGKFLGIILSLIFLGVLLTALFIFVIVGKVVGGDIVLASATPYDDIWSNVSIIFPGLLLGLLEAAVLVSISVALSIRLPMVLNVSISFALFLIARVSGALVEHLTESGGVLISAVAKFFSYVLPNLSSNTEVYSSIGLGRAVPAGFVGWAAVYSLLYIVAAISVAVFLFQDRELG
jgi:ABC-type transport system involved in multi-copper enzyme maturation permease subunit